MSAAGFLQLLRCVTSAWSYDSAIIVSWYTPLRSQDNQNTRRDK